MVQPTFPLPSSEVSHSCNFAPRILSLSKDKSTLFVGCKDGSVQQIILDDVNDKTDLQTVNIGANSRVRSICNWDENHILIGRTDGTLEVFPWKSSDQEDDIADIKNLIKKLNKRTERKKHQDPVHAIGWVDTSHLFLSYRSGETYIIEKADPLRSGVLTRGNPQITATDEQGKTRIHSCGAIHIIVSLSTKKPHAWLAVTERGQLFQWNGGVEKIFLPLKKSKSKNTTNIGVTITSLPWPAGEFPGLINSFTYLNSSDRAQGVILGADTGIYLIIPQEQEEGGGRFAACRLSLPGIGAMCTALSATIHQVDGKHMRHLWVADSSGNLHLFWDDNKKPSRVNFRRAGTVHTDSQILLLKSWFDERRKSLAICKAQRNDRITTTFYRLRRQETGVNEENRIRSILMYGDSIEITEFLKDDDHKRDRVHDDDYLEWDNSPESLLVELFERLGAEANHRRILLESLLGPMQQADAILSSNIERLEQIIKLWVPALLAVIHRHRDSRDTYYLNLLRWLRNRQHKLEEEHPSKLLIIGNVIEDSIRFIRKWGVFGETEAWRENIVIPFMSLERQNESRTTMDCLVYRGLLFKGQVNLINKYADHGMRGRRAWDASRIEIGTPKANVELLAISWNWGGIEIYRIGDYSNKRSTELQLIPILVSGRGCDSNDFYDWEPQIDIRRDAHPFHRRLHFGKIKDTAYLLSIRVKPLDEEEVCTWKLEIEFDADGETIALKHIKNVSAKPGVYSIAEIEEGWLMFGLRGERASAQVALWTLEIDNKRNIQIPNEQMEVITLSQKKDDNDRREESVAIWNRIWSLAKLEDEKDNDTILAMAGCERGQIYRIHMKKTNKSKMNIEISSAEEVAHMNSAVLSVKYTSHQGYQQSGTNYRRVFAGGDDGSIVAWQELPKDGALASLWATKEDGAICDIHILKNIELRNNKAGDQDSDQNGAVLAITRSGRCILFNDRGRIGDNGIDKQKPSNIPTPGWRHGRPSLSASCFSSLILRELALTRPEEPYAVVLVASGDGSLSVIGLHNPKDTWVRNHHYELIIDKFWHQIVRLDKERGMHLLRQAGAVYRASPILELILVRWLLDPSTQAPSLASSELRLSKSDSWCLPRHLRPLREVDQKWPSRDRGSVRSREDIESVARHLDLSLRRAWQLDDIDLFKEICELILKKLNYYIYQETYDPSPCVSLGGLHEQITEVLRETTQRWLGAEERKEEKVQMVIAQNLVNGDTFWRILIKAAEEQEQRRETKEQLEAPQERTTASRIFTNILHQRIRGISTILLKRDPIVSLEAIRAINLSLLRLCKRLSDARKEHASERALCEVRWRDVFEPYFNHLITAATRKFHSRLELTDAFSHEYSRTFALAICICPSATIRIANRMTETGLISDPESEEDLACRVARQLQLLREIGLIFRLAESERIFELELYNMVANPGASGVLPVRLFLEQNEFIDSPRVMFDSLVERLERHTVERKVGILGKENARDIKCLCLLGDIVGEFEKIEYQLSNDASGIDLTEEHIRQIEKKVADLAEYDRGLRLYLESTDFWKEALRRFRRYGIRVSGKSEPIRPDVVLSSRRIQAWASAMVRELEDRHQHRRIFHPEYKIFSGVLLRLERKAGSFAQSAAVHKSMVAGVLGHHLLEDLDEHVLELIEIAHAIDPVMVWKQQDSVGEGFTWSEKSGSREASTSGAFARHLLKRSLNAANIPKNLRALQGLLLKSELSKESEEKEDLLEMKTFKKCGRVVGDVQRIPIWRSEAPFLDLVFRELAQNDAYYRTRRRSGNPNGDSYPQASITIGNHGSDEAKRKTRRSICFEFHFDPHDPEIPVRLREVKEGQLQAPFKPWPNRDDPSHGTGLYIANLAASIINWKIEIREIRDSSFELVLSALED